METAVTPRAERLWNLVRELKVAINEVGDYMGQLTPERGDLKDLYRDGRLRFTGWKWGHETPTQRAGFVAQWVWYNPDPAKWDVYVCLPAYCGEQFKRGERLDISTERVTGLEPDEKIVLLVTSGKKLLLELVDQYLDHPEQLEAV